jgi:hypothetical protein
MLGEQYTAAGIGHVDTYWTADFGSVADPPLDLETLQTYGGRLDKPTAGERNSTPPSATEQATGEREGDGQPTVDERTPEEQAQVEGTQPEARGVTVENGPVAGETETTGQTPTQQQATVGQVPEGEAPTRGETPNRGPNEETTLGTATFPQPPFKSVGTEQLARE